jgi:colanic acid biosynthesis glycosyl transferase WcaI
MRVVLLNQAFWPDVVATAQMSRDLADALAARGHNVVAVASRSIYGKSGATLPKRERLGAIDVRRVGASVFGRPKGPLGLVARGLDFLLFYALATWRVLTLPRADGPTVVVGFTTPPMIALVGLIARAVRGRNWKSVYWVMDLYPDVPVACGVWRARALHVRVLERISRRLLASSDAVVVLGRCMRQRVLSKGAPAERVEMIPVWPVEAGGPGAIQPVEHSANPVRQRWSERWGPSMPGPGPADTVVMYSGNFGIAHESATILAAMELLRDEPHLWFAFVGGGARRAEIERFIADKRLSRAHYFDYAPVADLSASLSAGDVHLVSIRPGLEGLIVPSKLYGAMAAGRPIVHVGSDQSEVALMVQESGCGMVVPEGDAPALARTLRELAADPGRRAAMGRAGLDAVRGKYDKASQTEAWVALLERLVGPPRMPTSDRRTPESSSAR